jgi:DNA polymerase
MDLITCDAETFYGDGYTLSGKETTTEAYVRDIRFETILFSFKRNSEPAFWVPRDKVPETLHKLQLNKHAVCMHHAHFDGFILNFHYDVRPRLFIDTLGMARAVHGATGKGHLSLKALAIHHRLQAKGEEVLKARNKRFCDFSRRELAEYGGYSCTDSNITYDLAQILLPHFDRSELEIHDRIIRMFTQPILELDIDMMREYVKMIGAEKSRLMLQAGVQRADLMSNDKFAEELRKLGIDPPMKISPAWLKKTMEEQIATPHKRDVYAFAKSDAPMQSLQEHPDERVQILVEARLKNKSTIAEKSGLRMIAMAQRGAACMYFKYSGASNTHRLSGADSINWQALKRIDRSLGEDVLWIRDAVMAPKDHSVVVGDSSNIEARMLDWLAGQQDMVEVYKKSEAKLGPDMYCVMGERLYKRPINKKDDPEERQFAKVMKLGLGFGMGAAKFIHTVRAQAKENGQPKIITAAVSQEVVDVYRKAHPQVQILWRRGESILKAIAEGQEGVALDYQGIVKTCKDGLIMPNGLKILSPDLQYKKDPNNDWKGAWTYWNGKAREHIYGPKVIENVVQCLARIVVFEQCLRTSKIVKGIARWVMSVHDEGVFVSHDFEAPWVMQVLMDQMRIPLWWCETLPLNSEGGFNRRYGRAKS